MNNLGQLIMTGISGKQLNEAEINFIEKENIGGVVLFKNNYENPAQLAELINSIQNLRQDYPLFISVDHEGGRVQRFRQGFTHFPPMLEIGKLNSPKLCFEMISIMANELKICGINVNFSPVCDILFNDNNQVIGDRSFGADNDIVVKNISSAIRGLQTNGVMACAKHFPGHGRTEQDSHFSKVVLNSSLEELRTNEFLPFIKAVKSRVEFVMMSHLIVDKIDAENPASLSKKSYDILYNELKFSKLAISDDMEMKAITDHYTTAEAASLAISVGADIVMYRSMEKAMIALQSLKDSISSGVLKKSILKIKYKKIEGCKKRNLSDYRPSYIPDISKVLESRQSQVFMDDLVKRINRTESSLKSL